MELNFRIFEQYKKTQTLKNMPYCAKYFLNCWEICCENK